MAEPQASPKKTLSLPGAPAAPTAHAPADVRAEIAVEAQAPDHWPADVRAEFAKATPLWQQLMVDRSKGMERGYTKRSRALAAERKASDEYRDRWRSYADRLAEIRGEPVGIEAIEALVERLLEFDIAVEAAPPEGRPAVILNVTGAAYGLPVGAFAETIMAALHAGAPDLPAAGQAQAAQQEQQRSETQMRAAVQTFAEEKTEAGTLAHPYFAEVEDEMRDLAHLDKAKGLQPSLGDLYSKAIRLNPVVNAKVAETDRRRDSTQRDADERERISRARAASGSISGAGGGSRDPVGGSVAEILDRAVPTTGW